MIDKRPLGDMKFDEYQIKAREFDVIPMKPDRLTYCGLGLSGEAGEVSDKIKKLWRDFNGKLTESQKSAIIFELGDCLWYIAAICDSIGCNLSAVPLRNIEKLTSRKERNKLHGEGDNR